MTSRLVRYVLANTSKGILVEAGCGSGEVSLKVAEQRGDRVILVDRSSAALSLARRAAAQLGVEASFIACDIGELSAHLPSAPDHLVYNIGVIEHFADPSTILQEMAKVSGREALALIPERSLFWLSFIWLSRRLRLVPKEFFVLLHDQERLYELVRAAGLVPCWVRRARVLGIIPYLGIAFARRDDSR